LKLQANEKRIVILERKFKETNIIKASRNISKIDTACFTLQIITTSTFLARTRLIIYKQKGEWLLE